MTQSKLGTIDFWFGIFCDKIKSTIFLEGTMNIGNIIKNTWNITLKNRFLWLLGILAAISVLGNRFIYSNWLSTTGAGEQILSFFSTSPILTVVLLVLLSSIILIAIYLSFSARAGTISATDEIISGKDTNFNSSMEIGQRYSIRLIGIYLFLALVVGIFALVLTLPIALVLTLNYAWAFDVGLILLIIFIIIFILIVIYLSLTAMIAERVLVLENLAFFTVIKKSLIVVRHNFWHFILVSLINFIVIIAASIIGVIFLTMFAILATSALAISVQTLAWIIFSLLVVIGGLILILFVGFVCSFCSVYWTQIYLKTKSNG